MQADIRRLLAAFALIAFLPSMAIAGGTQCSSSEAAESLVSCDHCQEWKELLGQAADISVEVSVHELARGVIIDFSAEDDKSLEFVHTALATLWGIADQPAATRVTNSCSFCAERSRNLQAVERDHALTDHGAFVILTSDDDKMVNWSRKDARSLQSLIERSASSH